MIINGKQMHEFSGSRVKIMVTSRCTTNCKHCCLNFVGTKSPEDVSTMVLALQEKYEIRLDGSELLLNEEYINIMKRIGQDNVLTNGRVILQNPERCIRILRENDIKDVYFSYHYGLQHLINDIPLVDVEQAINIIKNAGFRIGIMTTVTNVNMHQIEDVCKKAIDLGAFFIQVNPLILQGQAKLHMKNYALSSEEMDTLRQKLLYLYDHYSNRITIDLGKAFEATPGEDFFCRAVEKKVWIGIDNKVYPCIFLLEPGMEIGIYQDGKVWIEDSVHWGGNRCAAYLYCNEHIRLWKRGDSKIVL